MDAFFKRLLAPFDGAKTKLAALMVAVLALNMVVPILPDQAVTLIFYLANALGLYGVRDAIDKIKPPNGNGTDQNILHLPPGAA